MQKYLTILGIIITSKFSAQAWKTDDQYIQKFAQYAVEEMEKYKIPASITLAQGLLETGGGQSRLAQEGNNHFGIKCKEDWTGKTMKHTDDAPNECFRVYNDPKQSYEDHSVFLATRKFYVNLFKLDPKDYKAWAHGLKKAGYATNPKYASILISKIEKYKLYEFDNTTSKEVLYAVLKLYPELKDDSSFMAKLNPKNQKVERVAVEAGRSVSYSPPPAPAKTLPKKEKIKSKYDIVNSILVKNHPNGGKKFLVVPEDLELSLICKKFGVSENKIMKWNELSGTQLKKNEILFLEGKNSEGNVETYTIGEGENMHDIAQKFGVKLDKLYAKNRMQEGQQPKTGELLYLKGKKPRD